MTNGRSLIERWDAGCDSRPLLEEADRELERLRSIENAAMRLAGTFKKRNNTVDPVAMHKLDFALEAK